MDELPQEVKNEAQSIAKIGMMKFKAIIMYLGTHGDDVKSDLTKVMTKCRLFRKNNLCKKCVMWIDGQCVFYDKHYPKFIDQQMPKEGKI